MSLSQQFKKQKFQNPVDQMLFLLSSPMECVNKLIEDRLQSEISLIPDITKHIIFSGGKRLRPLLTLASAELCGYEGDKHIPIAAAIEFVHTATLLHDDVVDQSFLRRGKESANAVWGNKPSVLVGDFLFSRAFELMVESDSLEVLSLLSTSSRKIAEGEVAQINITHNLATTIDDYLHVIESKTARLFAAAMRSGGILADESKDRKESLECFGLYLGIAFQLVDDILDYCSDDPQLGKEKGNDFNEGKVTLPIIYAYQKADEAEKDFWVRVMEQSDIKEGDLQTGIHYLHRHKAFDYAFDLAKSFQEKALACLAFFPETPLQQALADLAHFVVERRY